MFWSNAAPRRQGGMVETGKEVLIQLEESPLIVDESPSSPRSGAPAPSQNRQRPLGSPLELSRDAQITPTRSNARYSYTSQISTSSAAADEPSKPSWDDSLIAGSSKTERKPRYRPSTGDKTRGMSEFQLPRFSKESRRFSYDDLDKREARALSEPIAIRRASSTAGMETGGGYTDESELEEVTEEDDEDDDDVSSAENPFFRVMLKVSARDGIVTLEYPVPSTDNITRQDEQHLGEQNDENEKDGTSGGDDDEEKQTDEISSSSSSSDDESGLSSSSSSCDEEEEGEESSDKENESRFKLICTRIQEEEDKEQKEHDRIRRAALEAAEKSYKKHSLEVPDILMAQLNQKRGFRWRMRRIGQSAAKKEKTPGKDENDKNGISKRESEAAVIQAKKDPSSIRLQENKEEKVTQQKSGKVKKIKLTQYDEIHATPCQCALKLVGMTSVNNSNPFLSGELGLFSKPQTAPIQNETNLSDDKDKLAPPKDTASRQVKFDVIASESSETTEKLSRGRLVRTASAKGSDPEIATQIKAGVQNQAASQHILLSNTSDDGSPPLQLGGPPESDKASHEVSPTSKHRRPGSGTYTSMGCHEIILIRGRNEEGDTEQGLVQWDALTIRCKDHDEMDIIIEALRDSSKATVVPFSSDPKAKLRKRTKGNEKVKKRKTRRKNRHGSKGSGSLLSDISIPAVLSEELSLVSSGTSPEKAATSMLRSSRRRRKKKKERRRSHKWSYSNHCELCGFHFTLLTRRHHCRRCDRSCCSDCSAVTVIPGGQETRYCNFCFSHTLRKQSRAIRRRVSRFQRKTHSTVLPGKVHPECRRLGVGILGKLPHWKYYLARNPEDRPAVGRLTVEVIEALALPTADITSGKADPYVRATITGYDRNLKWQLKEWLPSKQFSLCSAYSSATLSPMWSGSGLKGGQLLTLPVISTAGAVLRLEVLHYDVMTNSKGKDKLLGVVEIPLSDFPNANLRKPRLVIKGSAGDSDTKIAKKMSYDGYCDRWYRLQCKSDFRGGIGTAAKPLTNPEVSESIVGDPDDHVGNSGTEQGDKGEQVSSNNIEQQTKKLEKRPGLQSLREIGQRVQGVFLAPVDWMGSALNIDAARRRPETVCEQHKLRSAVHVRIKLNASEFGDMMSHTWFPPVQRLPDIPPFDPQKLWTTITRIGKQIEPYQKIQKFLENTMKWKHDPKICVACYCVFALHIIFIEHFLFLVHIYLLTFLSIRFKRMVFTKENGKGSSLLSRLQRHDSSRSTGVKLEASYSSESDFDPAEDSNNEPSPTVASGANDGGSVDSTSKSSGSMISRRFSRNRSSVPNPSTDGSDPVYDSSRSAGSEQSSDGKRRKKASKQEDEESAHLHVAIQWIAKWLGDNIGLETLQYQLSLFERDVTNFNSLWDGTSVQKTVGAIAGILCSFVIHLYASHKLLWLVGTAAFYFGTSPYAILFGRSMLGLGRGVAKIMKRRHLHNLEVTRNMKSI